MPRISIYGRNEGNLFRSILGILKVEHTEEHRAAGTWFNLPESPVFHKVRTIQTMMTDFSADKVNAGSHFQFPGSLPKKLFKGEEREFTNGICKLFGILPTVELEKLVMDWAKGKFEDGRGIGQAFKMDYDRQVAKRVEATE